jgi:hypothetical protein
VPAGARVHQSGDAGHVTLSVGPVGAARSAVKQDQHVPERVFDDDWPDWDVVGTGDIRPPLATNTPAASPAERTFQLGS